MNKGDHVLNGVLLAVGLGVLLAVVPSAGASALDRSPVDAAVAVADAVARLFVPVALGALFPDVDTTFGKHRKTLHNAFVLGVFLAYPFVYANLQFVWIGVATHYVLDVVGSARGIAVFYPLSPTEYSLPGGVPTSSRWATPATVLITGLELGALALVHRFLVPLDAPVAGVAQLVALVG